MAVAAAADVHGGLPAHGLHLLMAAVRTNEDKVRAVQNACRLFIFSQFDDFRTLIPVFS